MPKLRVIIKPPPEPQGDAEQQTEALRDYLLQMSEELAYVLTHLEADNINDSTFERIQSMIPRPYTGLPVMDGDASSGQSAQWARGDHRHGHDSTKADVTALATETAAREAHEADTGNPHEVTKSQVGLGNVANERQYSTQNPPPIPTPGEVGAIPATEKGSAGGVAELDSGGHVPSSQLPSYVDDVKEYPSVTDFPIPGESDKIYIALDTDLFYRWGGTVYAPTNPSLALGETSSTAYRGDRGKIAYDHSQVTSGNPHNVSASDVGLGNVANERQYSANNPPPLPTPADIGAATAQDLTDHVGDTANPHGVTAAQVGLGNVDNVQQYSASNPPPYPVTSVNGSTGAVTLDASDVGARADTWMPTAADVGARPDTWTPSAADVGARPDTWVPDAEDVPYDNTQSGLTATDLQAAVDELANGGGGGGPSPSDNNPAMDGTAAPGTSLLYSRSDHVHPVDTSRAVKNHASSNSTFGVGTANAYGHLKLSDSIDVLKDASGGTAATPNALYGLYAEVLEKANWDSITENSELGTTAIRAYQPGEYFRTSGAIYKVKQPIAIGDTFTSSNAEETTVLDPMAGAIFGKTIGSWSETEPFSVYLGNSSAHLLIVTSTSQLKQAMVLVNCSSIGAVVTGTVYKGSNISVSSDTGRVIFTLSTRGNTTRVTDIPLVGDFATVSS